jgi:predicted amidophosphoribosyltransferase
MTKRLRPISTPIDKEVLPDFIKTFTKPSTVSIEEVELCRKEGLCLVCKSKVSRLNYLCPKCNALYCIKCSEALTNLENMCWVCDTPFDESTPLKF